MLRFLWIPLFASFLFSGCDRGKNFASVRNLDSPGENVICFGDSLTEGVGAGRGEDYPSILARQFVYPVMNAGRAGDTSAESLARLDRDVLSQNPRLVVVLLGGNDFLRRLPLSDTKKNVEEIIRRVQESGAMVVLVGIRLGLFTDEYGPAYEEIAKRNRAVFIPEILKGILSEPKLRSDSVHPNAAGYQLIAQRISERIRPLLEEAERKRLKGRRVAELQG